MLVISFDFVNCVIISCKLSYNSRFSRNQSQIPIMSFLGFKKAELGYKKPNYMCMLSKGRTGSS